MSVTDEERSSFMLLQQTYASLRNSVQVCEAGYQEQHARFAKEMAARLPGIRARIAEARNTITMPLLRR